LIVGGTMPWTIERMEAMASTAPALRSNELCESGNEQAEAGNELLLWSIEQVAPSTHSMETPNGSADASTCSVEVRK
jgi:hypothetical protein